MLIYIDESGTFTLTSAATGICLVGALILTEGRAPKIERKYQALRKTLPREKGEVKGRLLTEGDIEKVVELLSRNNALFEVVGIDLAIHTTQGIDAHKRAQEHALTANVPDDFPSSRRDEIWDLRRRLEEMPRQLYVQSVATIELIGTLAEHATLYYSQREPRSLEKFHWIIDAKDRGRLTDWEAWWAAIIAPATEDRFRRRPMKYCPEVGDYSFFARFDMGIPDRARPHLHDPRHAIGTNATKLLKESFRFADAPEPGLEMVDVLTNATRRALSGRLKPEGWGNIRKLMIHRRKHYINLITIQDEPSSHHYPYGKVLRHFSSGGKNLLAPRFNHDT